MIVLAFRAPVDPIRIAPLKRTARELERRLELPFDRFVPRPRRAQPGRRDDLAFKRDEA